MCRERGEGNLWLNTQRKVSLETAAELLGPGNCPWHEAGRSSTKDCRIVVESRPCGFGTRVSMRHNDLEAIAIGHHLINEISVLMCLDRLVTNTRPINSQVLNPWNF